MFQNMPPRDEAARALVVSPPAGPTAEVVSSSEPDASRATLLLQFWQSQFPCENTRRSYHRGLRDFCEYFQAPSVVYGINAILTASPLVIASAITAWRKDMLERRGLAPATVNNRVAAIRSLQQVAFTAGFVDKIIPIKDLKVRAYRDTSGPGLENIRRMFRWAGRVKNRALRARNIAILRLFFDLGLRATEVVTLSLADYDATGKKIWILGKGQVQRIPLSVPDATAAAMDEWFRYRGHAPGPLFKNLSRHKNGMRLDRQAIFRLVRGLGDYLGIRTSPHKIRHTAITEVCRTEDLIIAKEFARHSDPKTTMIYVDNLQDRRGEAAQRLSKQVVTPKAEENQ
jgi:integrase/recombinase XerC